MYYFVLDSFPSNFRFEEIIFLLHSSPCSCVRAACNHLSENHYRRRRYSNNNNNNKYINRCTTTIDNVHEMKTKRWEKRKTKETSWKNETHKTTNEIHENLLHTPKTHAFCVLLLVCLGFELQSCSRNSLFFFSAWVFMALALSPLLAHLLRSLVSACVNISFLVGEYFVCFFFLFLLLTLRNIHLLPEFSCSFVWAHQRKKNFAHVLLNASHSRSSLVDIIVSSNG